MNCIIPGGNLKVFGKAIHALAKVGDEVYFDANQQHLALQTVNISTTVFGVVKFGIPFFTHYKIKDDSEVTDSQKGVSCKMPMKALLGVFKSPQNMEKQVEICQIEVDSNPTKLLFKFKYKYFTKTQYIWLLDGDESLQVAELTDHNLSRISAESALYTQALASFQASDDDICFDVTPEKTILRNYDKGDVQTFRRLRSQLTLSTSAFRSYKIDQNIAITFSLRHFRAAVQFAEYFNLEIAVNFQLVGKPVEIIISNNITFEAKFILASLSDSDTQSTSTLCDIPALNNNKTNQKDSDDFSWDNFDSEEVNRVFKTAERIQQSENIERDIDLVDLNSPESPRSKKMKFHFGRWFDKKNNETLSEILAANSDPECEDL